MPSEAKSESKQLTSESKSRTGSRGDDCKADAKDAIEEPNVLIKSVVTFFFEDDAFAQTFETFAQRHCMVFDLDEEEMKLEYTDIYNQFLALFEEKLEGEAQRLGRGVDGLLTHALCILFRLHRVPGRNRAAVLRAHPTGLRA